MTRTHAPETPAATCAPQVPQQRSGGSGTPPHRVVAFARAVDAAFDRLGGDPARWAMTPTEQREALLMLDKLGSRLTALNMKVLAAADRNAVGADAGATSTAAWLADRTRQSRRRSAAGVRLGTELDETYTATGKALAEGRINPDQAAVIVAAVNALTREHDDLPVGIEAKAEAHLLELAGRFDAIELRKLGKRLFEVVCPEAADAAEGEKLEKEEERARRIASLSMRDNGDGLGALQDPDPARGTPEEGAGGADLPTAAR